MEFYKRLGTYFFVIGALLAIFAGVFPVQENFSGLITVAIIFLGVFAAILNVDGDDMRFVMSAAGFLIVIVCAEVLLKDNMLIGRMVNFFDASALFVGSMLATVTLKLIVEFGGAAEGGEQKDVTDRVQALIMSPAHKAWHFIVFIAVAATFILILLEVFFAMPQYEYFFFIFDIIITGIFFIDLVILYRESSSFGKFIRTSWLDILATIPFYQVLRVAKLARIIRVSKFLKLNRTLKFFSEQSGVQQYIKTSDGPAPAQPAVATQPVAQPTTPTMPVSTVSSSPSKSPASKLTSSKPISKRAVAKKKQ